MWQEKWFCLSLFTKVCVKGGVLFTLLVKIVIAYERILTNWLTVYHVAYSTESCFTEAVNAKLQL